MLDAIRKSILEANPDFVHHKPASFGSTVLGEIVFGAEDGMVSTMAAVTGIAAASGNHFITILSGLVIVSVESISMAVGSFLSTKSEKEMVDRILKEESIEIDKLPDMEEKELVEMYKEDGWPAKLATDMGRAARDNKELFLKEMAYRELKVIPGEQGAPLRSGIAMGISYVIGGLIPLIPYFVFSEHSIAIPVSVTTTLLGLFILGSYTTKFTRRIWWKAGLEMFGLATAAALVGYSVGQFVDRVWFN